MRSSFLPKCQPKISQISALTSNKLPGQQSEKCLVCILGEMVTSSIHSEFNWPLIDSLYIAAFLIVVIMLSCQLLTSNKWPIRAKVHKRVVLLVKSSPELTYSHNRLGWNLSRLYRLNSCCCTLIRYMNVH